MLEHAHTGELLKELRDKSDSAAEQLTENQGAYERTKTEYDQLEQELEELNEKMDQLRQESSENAVKKQQLEGSINVLLEQISAARQNEDHYQSRLNVIKEDLKKREGSCQEFGKNRPISRMH